MLSKDKIQLQKTNTSNIIRPLSIIENRNVQPNGITLLGDLQFSSDAMLINEFRNEADGLSFSQEGLYRSLHSWPVVQGADRLLDRRVPAWDNARTDYALGVFLKCRH